MTGGARDERGPIGDDPVGDDTLLNLLPTSTLLTLPDPEWLMNGVLPMGAVSVIYGQPETGKSFVALDWAMCISEGRPWLGKFATKQAPVIYIAAEGGTGIKKRVAAWMAHHEVRDLEAMYWQVVPLHIREEGAVDRVLDQLDDDVVGINPGLVVFDTLSRSFSNGDENASTDMVHFVDKVIDLSTRKRTAVLIVHHTNATGSRERGHGSLRGNVNTMFKCISSQNGDRKLIHVTVENDKQKDDAKLADIHLEPLLVRQSLVLVAGEPPEKKKGPTVPQAMRTVDMKTLLGTHAEGLTWKEWQLVSGVDKNRFNRRLNRLMTDGDIFKDDGRYYVTPANVDIAFTEEED